MKEFSLVYQSLAAIVIDFKMISRNTPKNKGNAIIGAKQDHPVVGFRVNSFEPLDSPRRRYILWSALFVGVLVASALSLVTSVMASRTISSSTSAPLGALPSPGGLDPSFGTGGKVTTDLIVSANGEASALALQADGKVVVAGYADLWGDRAFGLMRFNLDGSLDRTFGGSGTGKVATNFSTGSDEAYGLAMQADGKIVAAGYATTGPNSLTGFALARYNPDGTLDPTFGTGGKVITTLYSRDKAKAVAIRTDGKIVAVGLASGAPPGDFAVARYNSDGSLDTTFSGDGMVITPFEFGYRSEANAVLLQPDDKIVAVGRADTRYGLVRYNSDGSLDTSFDGDGMVTTFFSGVDVQALDAVLQPDGKIVAAGSGQANSYVVFSLARYNIDGTLDTSFDGDGLVTTDFFSGYDQIFALALQVDGKIVAAGRADTNEDGSGNNNANFALARYNTDGSLDTTFGGDGKVTTYFEIDVYEIAYGLAVRPNGRLVTGGAISDHPTYITALASYNPDGTLDSAFGTGGKVTMTADRSGDDFAYAVAVQPDAKIVTAGRSYSGGSYDVGFRLVRYNPSGSLDPTFGDGGKVHTSFGATAAEAWALAIQADEKVVAAGRIYELNGGYVFALARYNPNGTLDPSFGTGGMVTTEILGEAGVKAVALQPDGKIVAAGFSFNRFAVVRYNPNGTPDVGFGNQGVVLTDFANDEDMANAVALQQDGKIVVAGVATTIQCIDFQCTFHRDFALARYNPNGTLDTGFGSGGKATTDFPGVDRATGVAILPDGKIVAGGSSSSNFALARYNPNGTLDSGFGSGGKVVTDFAGGVDISNAFVRDSDGKLLLGGYAQLSGRYAFALARYQPDGTLDTNFGTAGKVTTNFGSSDDYAQALALQPDGNILLAGEVYTVTSNLRDFGLARYFSSDGLPTATPTTTATPTSTATPTVTRTPTPLPPARDAFMFIAPGSAGNCVAPTNGGTTTVGCRFVLDLMVNTGSRSDARGQDTFISFTHQLLQNARVSTIGTGCTITNTLAPDFSTFDSQSINQICNGPGPCTFGNFSEAPGSIAFSSDGFVTCPAGCGGVFRVARIGICATSAGQAVLHWEFGKSRRNTVVYNPNTDPIHDPALFTDYVVNIVEPGVTSTPEPTPSRTATPTNPTNTPTRTPTTSAVLVGHVTWQGRPAQPHTLQSLPITLTLKSANGETNYASLTTDASGFFTVPVGSLALGPYSWRVKGPKYLANSGSVNISGLPATQAEMGLLRAGDANSDNVVSSIDFNILRASFGLSSGQGGYDDRADFTGDQVVNATDFNLVRGNFGSGGAPPIGPGKR